ncbi:MAG TPA: hypothetical protein VK175_02840 [Leadbetterella sp.]|nr:hypothetical protein [Leadbetterella sp.]
MKKSYGDFVDSVENFDDLSQIEQVKYISYFYTIISGKEEFTSTIIGDIFTKESLYRPTNVTDCLNKLVSRKPGILLKKENLYTFHRTQKKVLDDIYLDKKHVREISETMRGLLSKVNSVEQKAFLEEAITCYEFKSYRAAIVMTWLLTVDILYEFVVKHKLIEFNAAMAKNGKYKNHTISKKEDFSELKENDFIMFLGSSSIITKDQKKILEEKLGIRNTAAHPNSIEIRESKASTVIEDLVPNIISKFQ